MRVYLPATSTLLRRLLDDSRLAGPLTGFAVTPGLREWYRDDDEEELEYAATLEAARASLRLLDADAEASRRRVVLAVEVPDANTEVRDDLDRGVVRVSADVSLSSVAAIHADDVAAEAAVTDAAAAINAADLGDVGAQDRVDDAEGHELSWYANQELAMLLESMSS